MQPIEDWLAKIGLERYAAAFANHDIDVAVLPHLTDADLEKVGVSLGHRRKILAAIAELRGAIRASPQPLDSAERRQVTVMFSDLVGSTALSARIGRPTTPSGPLCEISRRRLRQGVHERRRPALADRDGTRLRLIPIGAPRDKENKVHTIIREGAKRFRYAFLYGAGATTAGRIINDTAHAVMQADNTNTIHHQIFGTADWNLW